MLMKIKHPRESRRSPLDRERNSTEFQAKLAQARGEEGLGRFLLASTAYAEASRLDRSDSRPVLGRARALRAAGLAGESRRVLEEGLERNPASEELLLEIGEDELMQGRPERAAPVFRRILELRPDSRHARLRLAVALYLSGEKKRAVLALAG